MVGMIKVVKKDGTKEDFNVQKVVVAVNKSAYRALITFTQEELDFICQFVEEKVKEMQITEVPIATMHNIVEGALELSLIHISVTRHIPPMSESLPKRMQGQESSENAGIPMWMG